MFRYLIAVVIALMPLTSVRAQFVYDEDVRLSRKGSSLVYGEEKLSPENARYLLSDVYGNDLYSSWKDASRRYDVGKKLMISFGATTFAGASLLIAGAVWYNHYYDNKVTDTMSPGPLALAYSGVLAAVVGVAGLCTGTVIYISSSRKMDSIVDAYNYGGESRLAEASVSIGAQRNGLGLALIF